MADRDDSASSTDKSGTSSVNIGQFVSTASERFLAASGVCLIVVSVASFGAVIFREFRLSGASPIWREIFAREASTLVLLLVGIVCALLGLRLLTTTQNALARTIPKDDLPMIQDAVIAGKPDAHRSVCASTKFSWLGRYIHEIRNYRSTTCHRCVNTHFLVCCATSFGTLQGVSRFGEVDSRSVYRVFCPTKRRVEEARCRVFKCTRGFREVESSGLIWEAEIRGPGRRTSRDFRDVGSLSARGEFLIDHRFLHHIQQ